MSTRYVIKKVKDRWTVFSIVECWGKTYKNWCGEGSTKEEAEAIKAALVLRG